MATVKLFGDLGFDNSYTHVIDFPTKAARDTWFNSKTYTQITNANYNKLQNELKLEMSLEEANEYTYAIIDIQNKVYYCFIKSSYLVNEKTVSMQLETDVWNTFYWKKNVDDENNVTWTRGFTLGESFIARHHCDRWEKNNIKQIRVTPNAEPVKGFIKDSLVPLITPQYITPKVLNGVDMAVYWIVINYVRTDGANYTEFSHFMTPVLTGGSDDTLYLYGGFSGSKEVFKAPSLSKILEGQLEEDLGITVGSIVSVNFVAYSGFKLVESGDTVVSGVGEYKIYDLYRDDRNDYVGYNYHKHGSSDDSIGYYHFAYYPEISAKSSNFSSIIKGFYAHAPVNLTTDYDSLYEPALYTYPIMDVSFTDSKGNKLVTLKKDLIIDSQTDYNIVVNIKPIYTASNVYIVFYIGSNPIKAIAENSCMIYSCPTIDVTSNNWLDYQLTRRNTDIETIRNQLIQGTVNSALSTVGFAAMMKASVFGPTNTDNLSINKAVGVLGATGLIQSGSNAVFAMMAQQTKEREIKNAYNVMAIEGNASFEIMNHMYSPCLCQSIIDNTMYDVMAKEYHKYGYNVNEVNTPNIRSRKYFDYIQTNLVKINGDLNMDIKNTIATIFNKGVTIWHMDYATIGDYSKENIERALL